MNTFIKCWKLRLGFLKVFRTKHFKTNVNIYEYKNPPNFSTTIVRYIIRDSFLLETISELFYSRIFYNQNYSYAESLVLLYLEPLEIFKIRISLIQTYKIVKQYAYAYDKYKIFYHSLKFNTILFEVPHCRTEYLILINSFNPRSIKYWNLLLAKIRQDASKLSLFRRALCSFHFPKSLKGRALKIF